MKMAYQSRKNNVYSGEDSSSQNKSAEQLASEKAVKTAAKGAATYYGGALGGAAADIASNTKAGQKIIEKGGKVVNQVKGKSIKKLDDSGVIDAADSAISALGKKGGGGFKGSLPSFADNKNEEEKKAVKEKIDEKIKEKQDENPPRIEGTPNATSDNGDKKSDGSFLGNLSKKTVKRLGIVLLISFFLLAVPALFLVSSVSYIGHFINAFSLSYVLGEEQAYDGFQSDDEEQTAFYGRIDDVRLEYQANGKMFDPISVVAVYDVLIDNDANISYKDMSNYRIKEIVDSMFDGDIYSEEVFKNNLVNKILPEYLPRLNVGVYKGLADEIVEYVTKYNELAGREAFSSVCSGTGNCTYSIKGFYIKGKGNISKQMNLSNVYVRLMQCGSANGHNYGGTFGKPLEGEELVPFEKYILGVAYQEIGASAPKEAIKAQMVAARSYILARHVDMGGWRTIKKEGEKWVIQVASCTQDQVYCDPDKGCSSNDGQWGQIHSGLNYNKGFIKQPMAQNSPLRTYANETRGEVLVNKQGYVIYSGYMQEEQNKFSELARSGLNYKQILMQVYNQGSRNYGAYDLKKANCDNGENCGTVSTGEFVNWKQYGAPWSNIKMGHSNYTIGQVGCLVTSISMLIAKSGVKTNVSNFNPGTFVQYLNSHGGFVDGANLVWGSVTQAAPTFKHQGAIDLSGMNREQKLNAIKSIVSQPSVYATVEVKGNTGQHWVAIDSISGNNIIMMDPGSKATNLWKQYDWRNTSIIHYYKVG